MTFILPFLKYKFDQDQKRPLKTLKEGLKAKYSLKHVSANSFWFVWVFFMFFTLWFSRSLNERNWLIEEKTLLSPSQERVLSHWEVQVDYKILPIGAECWKDPLDSLGKKIAGEYCKQVLLVEYCLSEENWKNLRLLHRNCILLIPLVTVLQSPLKRQETENGTGY